MSLPDCDSCRHPCINISKHVEMMDPKRSTKVQIQQDHQNRIAMDQAQVRQDRQSRMIATGDKPNLEAIEEVI